MLATKTFNLKFIFPIIFGFILLSSGCQMPADNQISQNTNTAVPLNTNTNINSANATNSATSEKKSVVKLPVTLPVLDAMFFDEGFTEELKSKIGLTDEEIEKLKNASGEAVANLGEDEENTRSTRAATKRAEEQIRAMLGEEKANKLFELVSNRWASGESDAETSPSAKSNSIPSDTRIVVNAPAYRMDVFQDGKLIKTYKIGIGYPEFPLPQGLRKAETIIFNPTWTPPDEPWVKGKFKPYRKVEAGSKLNPLGAIKIPIGLPSLIHGGKQAARLGTFASHGCVGLTNEQVKDFSMVLAQVSGTQISDEDLKTYEKEKDKTKNVQLSKTIPVELRYETIVVENGKLKIYRDVYEKGTNTEENMRKVLKVYGISFDDLAETERKNILESLKMMNTDADGKLITETAENNSNSANTANTANSTKDKKDDGKVTRNIKGKKELEIVLQQLNGKGYPSAISANSGI